MVRSICSRYCISAALFMASNHSVSDNLKFETRQTTFSHEKQAAKKVIKSCRKLQQLLDEGLTKFVLLSGL
jgi:hypothetical protein